MQTPHMLSIREFGQKRGQWIAQHCHVNPMDPNPNTPPTIVPWGFLSCKVCGSRIVTAGIYFSVHDARFADMCVGSGKVKRLDVPFCPRCESQPEDHSCLHEHPLLNNSAIAIWN